MENIRTTTIKSIVTDDYRTAAIFEKYSLDFCCNGGVTVEQACATRNVDSAAVLAEIRALQQQPAETSPAFAQWPPDQLIEHIIKVHHGYVREAIPVIAAHTQKVASVHGERHPEVIQIAGHFESVAAELQQHMMKEERMLFPYIGALARAKRTGTAAMRPPFGTAQNPIRMMEAEHAAAGDALYSVRSLSANYQPPDDACTTYRVSYKELQHFENDLHQHVHLENNILFPKAIALENELFEKAGY